jgi:hypothetical protein
MLYKMSGERRYLGQAIKIADRLVRNVQAGDEANSPWPFRVNSTTGRVHEERNDRDHLIYRASYTTNWTGALRLFEDLAALNEGQPTKYRATARLVTEWLKAYPLKNNRWGPFFEDVSTKDYSDTEINADTLAFYILEHPDWDKDWKAEARGILDWSYRTFANHQADKWGVVVINEQTRKRAIGPPGTRLSAGSAGPRTGSISTARTDIRATTYGLPMAMATSSGTTFGPWPRILSWLRRTRTISCAPRP